MHSHIVAAERFSVNILAAGQEGAATHFAGRPVPHFKPALQDRGVVPTLPGAAALLTASVVAMHDCGDHTIFVGHITLMTSDERPPLLYHASHFAALVPLRESSPSLPEFW